jgi:hypothetical protein
MSLAACLRGLQRAHKDEQLDATACLLMMEGAAAAAATVVIRRASQHSNMRRGEDQ